MNQNFNQTPQGESVSFTPVKNASYYRARARERLKNRWGIAILVTLLAMLLGGVGRSISFNLNNGNSNTDITLTEREVQNALEALQAGDLGTLIDTLFKKEPAMAFLLPILGFVIGFTVIFAIAFRLFVSSPVKLGYQRFQLELIDRNESGIRVQTLFRFFKESYLKSIGLNVLHGLILFATSIPVIVFSILGVINFLTTFFTLLLTAGTLSLLDIAFSALGMVGLVLLGSAITLAIQIPVSYMYTYAYMIMAEYPTVGVVDALRSSRNLMRGKKWRLFCLEFSFIGWWILAALSCGIGYIVLTPYIEAARAAFYDDISNRVTAKETEFPSLNPDDYTAQ